MRLVPTALFAALLAGAASPGPQQVAEGAHPVQIYWHAPVREGQSQEARRVVSHMQAYLDAHYVPLVRPRVFQDYGPEVTKVEWYYQFPDMRAMELTMGQLEEDEGWVGIRGRAKEAFDLEREALGMLLPVTEAKRAEPDQAFRWCREGHVPPARFGAAVGACRRLAAHVETSHPEVRFQVFAEEFGDTRKLHWIVHHASPDAWRETRADLLGDATYLELLDAATSCFVDETIEDRLLIRM